MSDQPSAPGPRRTGRGADWVDPRAVLLGVLAFVVVEVATPIEEWPRFAAYAAILLAAVVACRVPPLSLLRRLALVGPFVAAVGVSLLIMPPSAEEAVRLPVGGLRVSRPLLVLLGSVAAKGALSVGALSLPVALWDIPTVLRALQSLRVPRLLVVLMAFMWRYLFLLGSEASRMVQARNARGSRGPVVRRARVVGAMIGSLFLRSYERAERVGEAMVARGYDGTVRLLLPPRALRWSDGVLLVVLASLLAAVRLA